LRSIPVADAHSHINPVRGLGVERVVERFARAGGWFIALVSLSPGHYGFNGYSLDGHLKALKAHVEACRRARRCGVEVACLAGVHPAEVVRLVDRLGARRGLELALSILDNVARLCEEGLCDGIGEVGRPHFTCSPLGLVASQLVMYRALELARELGVVVHLHLEQGGIVTALDVERTCRLLGVADRVLVHHAKGEGLAECAKRGLYASTPAAWNNLVDACRRAGSRFMVESDYLDDPRRPGVVVYPWVLVENVGRLVAEGLWSEEDAYRACVDMVCKLYRVEPP